MQGEEEYKEFDLGSEEQPPETPLPLTVTSRVSSFGLVKPHSIWVTLHSIWVTLHF